MYIHKEGYGTIAISAIVLGGLIALMLCFANIPSIFHYIAITLVVAFFLCIVSFFRMPKRTFLFDEQKIMCPADGTIVAIEEVFENEFLKENCRQISVFMSPANVHVNRYSISGEIVYSKYHSGKYFVASHPKSSLENERTSICLQTKNGIRIMERQVAGALARRIICYAKEGQAVKQNDEVGFIRFGSRVDVFIPLTAKVVVKLGDKVKNGIMPLAEL